MNIRKYIDLVCEASGQKGDDITAAYIDRAYSELDAIPELENVSLSLVDDNIHGFADLPHMVEIDNISVDEDEQGQGLGTKTMEVLCGLADTMGVTLVLRTWDNPVLDLDSWYSQFGFQGSRTMYRVPQTAG
jgi:GNAT superfamily N-acetyltransferase